MGQIAGRMAEAVIVTDDDPHSEDPASIRSVIVEAAKAAGHAKVVEEPDRREAFKKAFKMALPGDKVLLLGMGHQKFRVGNNEEKIPWDDRQVAKEVLQELSK
jgi:UDP-N-acetylmuramoyl-L-alanyl-D-glutamate--2,6-diaminopimelate ligase